MHHHLNCMSCRILVGEDGSPKACVAEGLLTPLIAQIHDELIFEVQEDALPLVAAMVKDCMEGMAKVFDMKVPLPVKLKVGPSYGELNDYTLVGG